MATTVNKTIKSAGGDYTSLNAWEAANQGDLVAADEIRQAECFDFADTSFITIDGSTTDATRYMRVYGAAGDEAQMPFSTSSYRLQPSDGNVLVLSDDYIRVERIQITCNATSSARSCVLVNNRDIRLVGVLLRNTGTQANCGVKMQEPASQTSYCINCVAINTGTGSADGFQANGGGANATGRFYNCTAIGWNNGFNKNARIGIAKNCLSYGNSGSDFAGTWDTGSDYNASEDATASVGANSRINQTFTFVNAGSGDYHLSSSDAGAKDHGVDLSADANFPFSTDFDGETRSGTWDIGADEIVSSTITGVSSVTIGVTGSVAGTVLVQGDASATIPVTGSATGSVAIAGDSSKQIVVTGTAAGSVLVQGASSQQLPVTGQAAGTVLVQAESSQLIPVTGAAAGTVGSSPITGDSSVTIPVAGSGAGVVLVQAESSRTLSIGGSIAGTVLIQGESIVQIPIGGIAEGIGPVSRSLLGPFTVILRPVVVYNVTPPVEVRDIRPPVMPRLHRPES